MNIEGKRSSGILLHFTSLPSEYGIGDLGPEAYHMADRMRKAGASLWQVLPLGPTGYGNSPYAQRSAFAANEMLISPEMLYRDGYLRKEDLIHPQFPEDSVDFSAVEKWKTPRLIKAAENALKKEKEAIAAFNKYVETLPEEQKTPDLTFEVGRLYYAEGTTADSVNYTPEMKKEALLQADSAFAKLAELVPDNYLGNFWRARTNSALDPETTEGLAKPYYEQVAAMLEEKAKTEPRYNRTIIECYRYLGYYYLVTEDYEKSKEYWNKILTIDPEDAIATKALEGIK